MQTNCARLRLTRVPAVLGDTLQAADAQGQSVLQVLAELLEEEVVVKEHRRLETTLKISGLPFL